MKNKYTLPYLNNWKLIALTIGINVVCACVFWHSDFGMKQLLGDTVYCGVITTFLDVFIVAYFIRKRRRQGTLPRNVPTSRLIGLLPRNSFGLGLILALVFTALMVGINGGLFYFYNLQSLSLLQFLIWKAVYSLVLSAWIIDFAIFRWVQPDCGDEGRTDSAPEGTVRNPMPRVTGITAFFQGMIFDFGFNVAVGLLLGGTLIRKMEVILMPIPCQGVGMLVTAVFTGIIVAFFVIPSVAGAVERTLREQSTPPLEKADRLFSWVPHNRWLLTLFLIPLFVSTTVLVCSGIFALFEFKELNFFQFYLIRVVYISLLCKAILPFIVRRYRQPDVFARIHQNSL